MFWFMDLPWLQLSLQWGPTLVTEVVGFRCECLGDTVMFSTSLKTKNNNQQGHLEHTLSLNVFVLRHIFFYACVAEKHGCTQTAAL
jgi:hypothetical protein